MKTAVEITTSVGEDEVDCWIIVDWRYCKAEPDVGYMTDWCEIDSITLDRASAPPYLEEGGRYLTNQDIQDNLEDIECDWLYQTLMEDYDYDDREYEYQDRLGD